MRRKTPLLGEVLQVAADPAPVQGVTPHDGNRRPLSEGDWDAAHEKSYGRPSASVMSSPMRFRNSVLMPGWKRSRSALPSASRPMTPASPSGTSATEPMLGASGPN